MITVAYLGKHSISNVQTYLKKTLEALVANPGLDRKRKIFETSEAGSRQ